MFVFGSPSGRAEFSLGDGVIYTGDDGKLHAVCDLSSYAPRASIGYIAVIIYSPKRAAFELSRVDIHSKTADSAEVSALMDVSQDEQPESGISPKIIVAGGAGIFVLFAVSARIVSFLSKHDAKNKASQKTSKKRKFKR